jgi:signal transduction histidine kinase
LNRDRYLALWGFGWITYSLGYVFYLMTAQYAFSLVFKYFFSLASSVLLFFGTVYFVGVRKQGGFVKPAVLLLGFVLFACLALSAFPMRPAAYLALSMLTAMILMIVSVVSGLAFLVSDSGGTGMMRQIAGWVFIVWGIHKGFYPFVSPDFYASASNCMSSIVMINAVNMAVILSYLEQNNRLLLEKEVQYRLLAEASEERLSNMEIMRKRFLASISHELRTPITSIIGNLSIITDGIAGTLEDSRRYAGISLEKSLTLNALIEDLHAISTREALKLQLNREATRVDEYIASLNEKFRGETNDSAIQIHFLVACGKRRSRCPSVMIDRLRIEQVLRNLIGNAVKHIEGSGSVTVSCNCARNGEAERPDEGLARIRVADTGTGIDAADLPYIFEMFYKKPNVKGTKGTGLGLTISKEIIQSHGGDIRVRSQKGAGAVFTIELPILQ